MDCLWLNGWERSKSPEPSPPSNTQYRTLSTAIRQRGRSFWGCLAMSVPMSNHQLECVLVDFCTQRDFCTETGAFPVANLAEVVPAFRRVFAWAEANNAPMISALDSHRRWELHRDGIEVHCFDGSEGQRKLDFTLLPRHFMVEGDNTLCVPIDLFDRYQQVVFRKRTEDLLANPKADRFLTQLPVAEVILFGNGLENSIRALTLALLARNKRVTVVLDACGYWSAPESELALRQIWAKGVTLTTVDELTARKLRRRVRSSWGVLPPGRPVVKARATTIIPTSASQWPRRKSFPSS